MQQLANVCIGMRCVYVTACFRTYASIFVKIKPCTAWATGDNTDEK